MESDEPLKFVLGEGGVIEGWERGLVGTCPGEKLELTIPPELAYGEEGNPSYCTGWGRRIQHRKGRETKQQTGT